MDTTYPIVQVNIIFPQTFCAFQMPMSFKVHTVSQFVKNSGMPSFVSPKESSTRATLEMIQLFSQAEYIVHV